MVVLRKFLMYFVLKLYLDMFSFWIWLNFRFMFNCLICLFVIFLVYKIKIYVCISMVNCFLVGFLFFCFFLYMYLYVFIFNLMVMIKKKF